MNMKRLISVIYAIFLALGVNADITPTSSQMWWGYFSESDVDDETSTQGDYGYGADVNIDAAIRVPQNHPLVGNSTIKAVRIWLGSDFKNISGSIRIWISTKLQDNTSMSDYTQEIQVSSLSAGKNDIELSSPFTVNQEEIYIGYSFVLKKQGYPILCKGIGSPGSFYFRYSDEYGWQDFSGDGRLGLQILLDGGTYPEDGAIVMPFDPNYVVEKGKSVNIPITVINNGKNQLKTISYTITNGDGSVTAEKTVKVGSIAYNGIANIEVSFDSDNTPVKSLRTLTVTKANGEPNSAISSPVGSVGNYSVSGSVITVNEKSKAVPVVEEFTGTWCGWCPRGIVGMNKAHERFGEDVVLIALHSDIMGIYDSYGIYTSGFPNARLNRTFDFDPNAKEMISQIEYAMTKAVPGSIQVYAGWTDSKQTSIYIDTKTLFQYNDKSADYAIGYVILEDGMKGSGSDWAQANYYSGYINTDGMEYWFNAPESVSGLEFDHVAVASWNAVFGTDGSVKKTFEAGETMNYRFKADISSNPLIQDKQKLSVVAYLIDRSTGYIINAGKTTISDDITGIISEEKDATIPTIRYNVAGQVINSPKKGLNIIKLTDGTTRKVFVK